MSRITLTYLWRVYEQQSLLITDMVCNHLKIDSTMEIRLDDDYKRDLKKTLADKIDKQD